MVPERSKGQNSRNLGARRWAGENERKTILKYWNKCFYIVINSDYENLIIKKLIQKKVKTTEEFFVVQRKLSKEYKKSFPSNIELLKAYRDLVNADKIKANRVLENLLKTRKIRTLSGIASITVITSSRPKWASGQALSCPGKCLYCPDEPDMPKSYLANEPACMRAVLTKFDPYKQVEARLNSLAMTGHATDKIELIVLGGTWSVYPKNYQTWFIKRCFAALNIVNSEQRTVNRQRNLTLKELQKINETVEHRCVGLTLETRPDYVTLKEIKRMRWLGCTRVELGVQSIYDDILEYNKRGHDVATVARATKLLKDAGLKVTYHMMLNLPGSTPQRDEKMFEELFSNNNFQPDQLKIYPCAVLKTSPLYKIWKQGRYKPYSENQLINLLIKIKKKIPSYVRIIRIIRDIPSQSIIAGSKTSNLRQIIADKAGRICKCIRCREPRGLESRIQDIEFRRQDYSASGGKEIFLSFEDVKNDKLLAFLRLRVSNRWSLPVLKDSALIRELHVYGKVAPLNPKSYTLNPKFIQHKGLGKKLMAIGEKIAKKEFGFSKIAVISGIGVREYYRKLGYKLKDEYMIKSLA